MCHIEEGQNFPLVALLSPQETSYLDIGSNPFAGIDRVGLDGTLYDQILDFIFYLGLEPQRFKVSTNTHLQIGYTT